MINLTFSFGFTRVWVRDRARRTIFVFPGPTKDPRACPTSGIFKGIE